jgi:hypothetical protein
MDLALASVNTGGGASRSECEIVKNTPVMIPGNTAGSTGYRNLSN